MKLTVKVIPNASKNEIVRVIADKGSKDAPELKVYLTAPAVDNKANGALIELLADHFDVKKRNITIISGKRSRKKIVNIETLCARI